MKKLSFVKEKLKRTSRNLFLSGFLLASFTGLKAQMVSNYGFSQSSGTYTPITGGNNMVLSPTATAGWDSEFFHNGTNGTNGTTTAGSFAAFPIGFNFNYNGTIYDGFYMSTDGALRLATTTSSSIGSLGGGSPISSTTATSINLISAFGSDLSGSLRAASATRTSGSPTFTLTGTTTALAPNIVVGMRIVGSGIPAGATVTAISGNNITMSANATSSSTSASAFFVEPDNISYQTSGTTGSRVLTVQWKNVQRWSASGDKLNFQIKLYEGTNIIEIIYDAVASTQATTASTVQVGLKGASATDFNNRLGTGVSSWSASTLGTSNSSAIAFQGTAATGGEIVPASGLKFTWTPPQPCTGSPIAGTVSPSTQTLLPGQTSANLVVSGFSSGVSGLTFQWEQSTDNTTWVNAVGGTGATTSIYTPPIYSGTTIYYRCKVTCTNSSTDAFTSSVVLDSCPATISYSNDFESTTGSAFPQCWAKIGTTGAANTQASTAIAGTRNLYMYSSSSTAVAYVMMPTVSNLQAGTHRLKFKARSNLTVGGKIDVGYFTTPGDVTTFTQVGSSYTTTSITVVDNFDTGALTLPAGVTNLVFKHNPSPANSVLIDDVVYEQVPSCVEPTAVTVTNITNSSASVSWTAPATVPANGYEYYYSTTNTAPTTTSVATGTSATASTPLSSLSPSTTYYIWVRSVCSSTQKSAWSNGITFTTACNPITTFPWSENFDTMTTIGNGVLPSCWTTTGGFSSSYLFTTQNAASQTYNDPRSAPNYVTIYYPTTAAYLWAPAMTLTAGQSYDFSFYWAGDATSGWVGDVLVNNSPSATGATNLNTFVTQTTTTTNAYTKVTVTFVPATTGSYNFGIKSFSATSAPYYMGFDDFNVQLTPACAEPTSVAVNSITSSSATLSWNAPATAPANGYVYAYSTTNTTPTSGTATTATSIPLSQLAPLTTYYYWVRSVCSATSNSAWVTGSFTTSAAPPANDDCFNATTLTPGATFAQNPIVGTTLGSTNTAPALAASCLFTPTNVGGNVWYKVVVPASGSLTIETDATSPASPLADTVLSVFSDCSSTTSIACDDDSGNGSFSKVSLTGQTAGATLYVSVWRYGSTSTTDGAFQISAYDASLSTSETAQVKNNVTVYPNPFADVLNISDVKNVKSVSVIDIAGRLIKTIEKPNSALQLGELKSGMYIVVLNMNDGSKQTIKAIKK